MKPLHVRLPASARERIARIMEKTDCETSTETVKRALALYEKVVDVQAVGGRIMLIDRDKNDVTPLIL